MFHEKAIRAIKKFAIIYHMSDNTHGRMIIVI